jgi:hypothetical protein
MFHILVILWYYYVIMALSRVTDIHTRDKHMGTIVRMSELRYSKLRATIAAESLA